MYAGKRVVVCIPYGRKRTVSILLNYLRRDRDIVDEVQFWMNTDPDQVEDREWGYQQQEIFEGWVRCIERPAGVVPLHPKQLNTGFFYANTTDHDTLYFRFDDDIVYVNPGYFRNMVDFRLEHTGYLLVFGNIWNNAILSYVHQQAGRIGTNDGIVESPYCMDPVGWQSPRFANAIHNQLITMIADGTVDSLLFDHYELDGKRFSISNFVWSGEDCDSWGGVTGERDEEIFLTEIWPKRCGRRNVICGGGLVSHYSFFDQRPALDQTNILERYRELSQDALSSSYYALLGAASTSEFTVPSGTLVSGT